ncbi:MULTISPECIES: hypothetical protein [unclassified Xanthobacter]|uniref:hypothetical protein n=1 Tax=unclassified Xanthobacter TaxID=2623496 RepID=UPI001F3B613E|nr:MULTISPECIES: hypothetical protein [unclassified Xanthobacter]
MILVPMTNDEFDVILAALARAASAESDTRMVSLGNALEGRARRGDELRDAVAFVDWVKSAPEAERVAVGTDHWDRLEVAARRAVHLSDAS